MFLTLVAEWMDYPWEALLDWVCSWASCVWD